MNDNFIISGEYVIFSPFFNQEITEDIYKIIKNIKKIIFSNYSFHNKKKCIKLNNEVTCSTSLSYYNRQIEKYPENIETIIFGWNFNTEINDFPDTLKCLIYDQIFNKPINNLPSSLDKLVLGERFNQSLDYLPSSIIFLSIYAKSFEKLSNLPSSIQTMTIHRPYLKKIENYENYENEISIITKIIPKAKIIYI